MLENVPQLKKIDKQEFETAIEPLRVALVNAQYELGARDFPVVVVLSGDDGPASVEALHSMHEWMDGRYLQTHPLDSPSDEERSRPWLWRYWRRLPGAGRIGVFIEAWTVELIRASLAKEIDEAELLRRIEHVERFERSLVDSGVLLLKYWFHLDKTELRKRLKRAKEDPDAYWWVDEERARLLYERYDDAIPLAERILGQTSTAHAPWSVIDSEHQRARNLAFARRIQEALDERLRAEPAAHATGSPSHRASDAESTALESVDLSLTLGKKAYQKRRTDIFSRLRKLADEAHAAGRSTVLAFEGWDAAGKGGIIRRVTRPLDARRFKTVPIAAPTPEEACHHYLWRFWQKLPPAGKMTLFDRSWYGRVLVERVEELAPEADWKRAYAEIRDFETQLTDFGILLLKFWIHIDPDEQLRRFQEREQTAYKKHKITDEDYRNRERWAAYEAAVDDMVRETGSANAPWHLIPGNDKRFARIQVLETVVAALEAAG